MLFGKLSCSKNINESGVGLGLTICKNICEHMGGSIEVSSKQNKGSIFSFEVKVKTSERRKITTYEDDSCDENINSIDNSFDVY